MSVAGEFGEEPGRRTEPETPYFRVMCMALLFHSLQALVDTMQRDLKYQHGAHVFGTPSFLGIPRYAELRPGEMPRHLRGLSPKAPRQLHESPRREAAAKRALMFGRSVTANRVERTRGLPGDNVISEPMASLTHAITIRCPRHALWWLAQMGAGRAGWYSYDFIDNGRQPSAGRIVPELQDITPGMIFPALPGVTEGFTVLAFEPQRFLIVGWLSSRNGPPLVTWAFVLEDAEHGGTRLIVRAPAGRGYQFRGLPWWLTKRIVPVIQFIMQRKQLLEIARRADGRAANIVETDRASARNSA